MKDVRKTQRRSAPRFRYQHMTEAPSVEVDEKLPRCHPVEKQWPMNSDQWPVTKNAEVLFLLATDHWPLLYFCLQTNSRAMSPNPPSATCPNWSSWRVFLLTTSLPLRSRE